MVDQLAIPTLEPVVPVNICGLVVPSALSKRLALARLPVGINAFETEVLLSSAVQLDLSILNLPTRIQLVTWPVDGSMQPLPTGQTVIDVEDASIVNSAGSSSLINDPEVLEQIRSIVVVADSPVTVKMEPNLGAFLAADGMPLIGNGKRITRIVLDTGDVPANVRVALSTSVQAPDVGGFAQAQYRFADQIFTKSAAAATQDSLTPATMRARWRDALSPLTGSANFMRAENIGQKIFLVRNIGPGAIEAQLFGAMFKAVADDQGYIPDPDSGNARQTVNSSENLILESSIPFSVMQLGIAVAQAEVADQTARVIVEYKGMTDKIRA